MPKKTSQKRKNTLCSFPEEASKFNTLFETVHDGIILLEDFTIISCNSNALQIINNNKENIIGNPLATISPQKQADGTDSLIKSHQLIIKALSGEKTSHLWEYTQKDGSAVTVQQTIAPFQNNKVILTFYKIAKTTINKKPIDSLKHVPLGIIHFSKKGKIIEANEYFCRMVNYNQKELNTLNYFSLIHPDDRKKTEKKIQQIITKKGDHSNTTVRLIKKEGTIIWVKSTQAVIYSNKNATLHISAVLVDTTEQNLISQALKESELKYRAFIENSPDLIARTNKNNILLYINNSIEQITEQTPASLIGESIASLNFPKEFYKLFLENAAKAYKQKKPRIFEFEYPQKKGSFFYDWRVIPEFDKNNKIKSLLSISRNISPSKRAEMALRQEKTFITQLMEANPIGILVINKNRRIDFSNSWAEIILQISRSEIQKKPPYSASWVLTTQDGKIIPTQQQIFSKIFSDQLPIRNYRCAIQWENGTKKQLSINGEPIFNKEGKTDKAIFTIEDITTYWKYEKQLKQTIAEKDILVQEIHHRVKNNLAVILSILQFELDNTKNKQASHILKKIESRIYSISLIHQLLHKTNKETEINVKEYFDGLIRQLINTYQRKEEKIRWSSKLENIPLTLSTIKTLGLILNEIVSNSLKHAFTEREAGEIKVSLLSNEQNVILSISDNGIGIPNEIDPKEVDSTGLLLIELLCDEIKADLHIENNHGTTYILTIPHP